MFAVISTVFDIYNSQTASRHKGFFYSYIYKRYIVSSGIIFYVITVNANIFS